MSGTDERAPWMDWRYTDLRDDYIKAQLAQAIYYPKEDLITEDMLLREVPHGALLP